MIDTQTQDAQVEELIINWIDYIFYYLLQLNNHNHHDAQDQTQHTMLAVWIAKPDPRGLGMDYFTKAAKTTWLKSLRERPDSTSRVHSIKITSLDKLTTVSDDGFTEIAAREEVDFLASVETLEQELEKVDAESDRDIRLLAQCKDGFTEQQWEIVKLLAAGYKKIEIAQMLNLSIRTIMKRVEDIRRIATSVK